MADIKTVKNESEFWDQSVQVFKTLKPNRIALSGGSSADIIDHLKKANFDFDSVRIFQTDERFVLNDDENSNTKLLRSKLENSKYQNCFFPILETPEASVEKYEDQLIEDDAGFLFDMTVLGIGPDGHTASIFPNSKPNEEKLVDLTETEEFAIKKRLTLTFNALKKSKQIIVLMKGKNKREIFEKITDSETDPEKFPARTLLDWDNVTILFADV